MIDQVNASGHQGPGRGRPGARARRRQDQGPADRRGLPDRAEQDLHLGARPADRPAQEPLAAHDPAVAQLRGREAQPRSRPTPSTPRSSRSRPRTLAEAKTDLDAEHEKHESERQTLLTQVDQYQTDNSKMADRDREPERQDPQDGGRLHQEAWPWRSRRSASTATGSSGRRPSSTGPTAVSRTSTTPAARSTRT